MQNRYISKIKQYNEYIISGVEVVKEELKKNKGRKTEDLGGDNEKDTSSDFELSVLEIEKMAS